MGLNGGYMRHTVSPLYVCNIPGFSLRHMNSLNILTSYKWEKKITRTTRNQRLGGVNAVQCSVLDGFYDQKRTIFKIGFILAFNLTMVREYEFVCVCVFKKAAFSERLNDWSGHKLQNYKPSDGPCVVAILPRTRIQWCELFSSRLETGEWRKFSAALICGLEM